MLKILDKKSFAQKKKKKMPIWKLAIIDTTLLAVSMGMFMLFDYVLPSSSSTSGQVVTDVNDAEENNAVLAVNGDFYGNGESGIVIRNGVLYR